MLICLFHTTDFVLQLVSLDPEQRISSLDELAKHAFVDDVDWDAVLQMKIKPGFVPPVSTRSRRGKGVEGRGGEILS